MRTLSTLLLLALFFTACQNAATDQSSESEATTEAPAEEAPAEKKYTLTPFAPSTAYQDAEITSMEYTDGKFAFGIGGEGYELGTQTPDAAQKMCANSAKGQHIHLIVNNGPYAAKYVPEFEHDLPDGEHHLLAFLSRSYHESIKSPTAFVAQQIAVENKAITLAEDITTPMLFYSRPKGTYVGADTEKVMLDFYLVNAKLGDNYMVKAEINGEEHMLDTWQPYYVEGMPMGENTIKLTLLDKEGNAADVPLNPVERTFTLKEDPAAQ
ncbi:MAG: hypothetical protein AAF798_07475 [Bacteroidota bacterium]